MKESNNNNGLYGGRGGLGLWSFGHGGLLREKKKKKKKKPDAKEGGGGCLEKRSLRWVWVFEKRSLRWVSVFGVSVMEVSRERKKNLILKKKGEAAVWRKEVRDGFGSLEFRSWRFLERD
jgi:hypothetical protein